MTSPSSSNQIDAGIAPEALRSLRRGLERAHGFALFVAVIKTPVQCGALITLLREAAPKLHLHTVTLRADTTDILDEVLRQTAPDLRGPVMVVGLDAALPSDATGHPLLQALNLRRPEWPRLVQQPVVLWVPEYLYQLLARAVPDFLDWRSDTLHFPDLEPTQLQALYSATWDGGLDNRMPVAARMERIRELQSRVATNEASRDPVIRATVGSWLNELGLHLGLLGRSRESRVCFERELAIVRETGDREQESTALGNLGVTYMNLGDTRKAIKLHKQQLAIARKTGDRWSEGASLGNLGVAYDVLGDVHKAIKLHKQQLAIARKAGNRQSEGAGLGNLGLAYKSLGDNRKAIEFYEQALVIQREIGDRRGEGADLGNLGLVYKNLGDDRKAIKFYEQYLAIAREIGDRRGEGNALFNSALALDTLGRRAEAIARAEVALTIFEQIEDPNSATVRAQLAKWRSAPDSGAET